MALSQPRGITAFGEVSETLAKCLRRWDFPNPEQSLVQRLYDTFRPCVLHGQRNWLKNEASDCRNAIHHSVQTIVLNRGFQSHAIVDGICEVGTCSPRRIIRSLDHIPTSSSVFREVVCRAFLEREPWRRQYRMRAECTGKGGQACASAAAEQLTSFPVWPHVCGYIEAKLAAVGPPEPV